MATEEHDEVATVVEPGPDSVPMDGDAAGLESRVLLARARGRLLGWSDEPTKVGRYRVLERIGTGGMGVIFAAQDDELDRPVAIKILRSDVGLGSAGRQRLLREAQAIARLSHPNIVHVYEVGQDEGQVYLAMELVRGPTLRRWCTQEQRPWADVVAMFAKIGEGLAAAHTAGIVHRDFKPDNALVGDDGRPRVIDFGLARPRADAGPTGENQVVPASESGSLANARLRELDVTVSGTVVGTPAYMAPEQLERREPDARTDQFSFCASLFEMLYGKRPFAGSSYTELAKNISTSSPFLVDPRRFGVPEAVHEVVLRGLRRDPAQRYATMDELIAALRDAAAHKVRRRGVLLVGALAAAATVGLVASLLPREHTPEPPAAIVETPDPWAAIVLASDPPAIVDPALPDDPTHVAVQRLRNGLTLYVATRPHEPYVYATFVVRAGIREESQGTPLLAGMVVDAIYRGGERLGVADVALERPMRAAQHRLLEALPQTTDEAARNALLAGVAAADLASNDEVVLHDLSDAAAALGGIGLQYATTDGSTLSAQLPRHRLGAWMELLAEAVRRPVFRNYLAGAQVYLANTPLRSAGWAANRLARRELTAATGLHADFDEAIDYIRTIPLADARAFHRTWFVPNNSAIVLVGDVTMQDVMPLVEPVFGDWEPASLPQLPARDEPLAQPVIRHQVTDHGLPALSMTWPMPPTDTTEFSAFLALADSLARADGLGAALADKVDDVEAWVAYARDFHLVANPRPGQSLADVEREVNALIDAVADDRLPDEVWAGALARAGLQRASWARSAADAADTIATSFIEHRQWRTVAPRLHGVPDKAELVAAARGLRERSRVVVERAAGPTWRMPDAELPLPRMTERFGRHSAWVQRLVDAAVTPPEPRFLVEGSHYQVAPHGRGRVISVRSDSPLVHMSWVYPIGVDEDPWVCAAVTAHVRASTIPGVDFDALCTHDDVWVDVVAASEGFAARAPAVLAWLADAPLSGDEVRDYVEYALHWRGSVRIDPQERASGFHAWAVRGEHGIDARLPSDAELRQRAATKLPDALARARSFDPDVCFVGPDPEALLGLLPPAKDRSPTSAAAAPRTRTLQEPTIFLLHDPEADRASVRVALPWIAGDVREVLAAEIHEDVVAVAASAGPGALQPVWSGWNWWMGEHPLAIDFGYRASAADVPLALSTALGVLRSQVSAQEFARVHRRFEIEFRASRLTEQQVAERVRLWGTQANDPRVAEWLALPALSHADMRKWYERTANVVPIISIVGDANAIDLAALREHGVVKRFEIADLERILRDESMVDAGT